MEGQAKEDGPLIPVFPNWRNSQIEEIPRLKKFPNGRNPQIAEIPKLRNFQVEDILKFEDILKLKKFPNYCRIFLIEEILSPRQLVDKVEEASRIFILYLFRSVAPYLLSSTGPPYRSVYRE